MIGTFLPDEDVEDDMSSVPEGLIGTWTAKKISEEPPEFDRRFTIFADGHYELNVLSSEEGGPAGAPSFGIQTHQQEIVGSLIINGFYVILRPTSNWIDGKQMQIDNATEEKYVWEIFNTELNGIIGLKLDRGDTAHFFYKKNGKGKDVSEMTESTTT